MSIGGAIGTSYRTSPSTSSPFAGRPNTPLATWTASIAADGTHTANLTRSVITLPHLTDVTAGRFAYYSGGAILSSPSIR